MNHQAKIKVLLIEDNLADARFVEELLPNTLYEVARADSLTSASQNFSESQFDVVLLDLSLPDGQGIDTFITFSENHKNVPTIILTGLDDDEVAINAAKVGAQDYIQKKDINQSLLCRSIRYALERKQAQEDSKRLSLLEQREEFMATLTHDLKNPLIGANYLLESLADETQGQIARDKTNLLLQLRDSNKLLLSMIQNLIEVYRFEKDLDSLVLENTNLLDLARSCVETVSTIAENRSIELKTESSNKLKQVLADGNAIRRVIQNLLDNALKFTPAGGRITVKLDNTNGSVCVEIADTGPGISPEEQKLLFRRFGQGKIGKKYTPGTGLGLYLCKQIVDAHHGKIACISNEGSGTIFRVVLPAA